MAGYQGYALRHDEHEALTATIESERRDVMTTVTGTIVSYNPATQRARVRPHLRQIFAGQSLEAPVLEDVPVRQLRGGGFIFHAPIKEGDEVTLHFQQRSADPWRLDRANDGQEPGRMHQLSDAIAVPGSTADGNRATGMPSNRHHVGSDDGKHGFQVGTDGALYLRVDGADRVKVSADGKTVEVFDVVETVKVGLATVTFKITKGPPPRIDCIRGSKAAADHAVVTVGGPSDLLFADV